MKNPLVIILALLLVGGVLYWLLAPEKTEAPAPEANAPAVQPGESEGDADTDADTGAEAGMQRGYIGLTEAEAEALAAENEVMFRVVERDGELLPATRDYRPGRINAVVEAGVVTGYDVEGQGEAALPSLPTPEEVVEGHDVIIGMTQAEAEAYATANNVPFRIGSVDGEPRPVTMDYRPGRITASLEGGVVSDYSVE